MSLLKQLLKPLAEDGAQLTREQAAAALREILSGEVPEVEIAALLTVALTIWHLVYAAQLLIPTFIH